MGLNDTFLNVRSNLLLGVPLTSLNRDYSMVIQEENHRGVTGVVSANVVSSTDNRVKSITNVECEFCHKMGHTKDM